MIRWWPPIALTAMLLLGWAVGKGSTPLDEAVGRHLHDTPRVLLLATSWALLGPVLAGCVAVAAYRRRWRWAATVLICPLVTIGCAQGLKRVFDRRNGPYLEYPSGHTALMVAVLALAVVVAGGRLWAVLVAVVWSVLGACGLIGAVYHYLTDTIGAALLATALVCVAVAGARPSVISPP